MIGHLRRIGVGRVQTLLNSSYKTTMEVQILTSKTHSAANAALPLSQLLDLNDSKDAVYGALDAWVAWEQKFPIASIKQVLIALEKEQQWHRIVQVIKWMLSKGQGTTMATYAQLIRALDMDHRAKEAHEFWLKKIGRDLHSVPWKLCNSMITIYYRNNMLENLIKLFKGLEAFDRKPPEKSIVQKVADAYEMLGLLEEKGRLLEKYNHLFIETGKGWNKNFRVVSSKKNNKSDERKI
uniref:Pentacotripeptide-repeat region of PRORP domain-containing protein n=1 Tax=Populus trichocarpa TaxID=3694 RepID=A0A2K1ZZD6_POPTR